MEQTYLLPAISNGNPREQALIRKWWRESCGGRGEIVWEYFIQGYYADAIWFKESPYHGRESSGKETSSRFPLKGQKIAICEAKCDFRPELIGQALVYRCLIERAGAQVEKTLIFSEQTSSVLSWVAKELGLEVVEIYTRQTAQPDV